MTIERPTHADARIVVIKGEADFICTPARLEGEALERSREARLYREYLFARERYRDWAQGRVDPELAHLDEDA